MTVDAFWTTDNDWGIPCLDPTMQADYLDRPVTRWGSVARSSTMRGTWHFYTADYKFESAWKEPAKVPATKCVTCVELNPSTGPQTPRAMALWDIYRKRWLARFWQSKGIRIMVDVCVDPLFRDICLLGVPDGWRSYATRAQKGLPAETIEEDFVMCSERAGTDRLVFAVFGGSYQERDLCVKRGWLWVPEEADRIGKKGAAKWEEDQAVEVEVADRAAGEDLSQNQLRLM